MNSRNIILSLILISMGTTELAITAALPSKAKIKEAKSMYETFKNDIKCLFSRTKKCTPEQKSRIKKEGIALISILLALGFGTFVLTTRSNPQTLVREFNNLASSKLASSKYNSDQLIPLINSASLKEINALDSAGRTPLIYAIMFNEHKITKLLLSKGANPNKFSKSVHTPLQMTTKRNQDDITEAIDAARASTRVVTGCWINSTNDFDKSSPNRRANS